jgi:thiamine-phosphate pyrophosphorylase
MISTLTPDVYIKRMEAFNDVDIYPVTCEALSNGRTDIEVLDALLSGGTRIIQLRDKESSKSELLKKAALFRKKTQEHGCLLIINDHIDIALAVEADGVHLGQCDFPIKDARHLMPDKLIGASTHSREDAITAESKGASYYNIGPVYPTATKGGLSTFLGPNAIPEFSEGIDCPFTVMGGIKSTHFTELARAGARRIAMVTELTLADDIEHHFKEMRRQWQLAIREVTE